MLIANSSNSLYHIPYFSQFPPVLFLISRYGSAILVQMFSSRLYYLPYVMYTLLR